MTSGKSKHLETVLPLVDPIDPEDLIDDKEAARRLRQKVQTLAAWRCDGKGPAYIKIGRRVFYSPSALTAYIKQCVVVPGA